MNTPPFSDLEIDRFLAGELSVAEAEAFSARCAREPALQARVDELVASRRAFAVVAPSFAAIRERAARPPLWRRFVDRLETRVAAAALAAAAVVVVAIRDDVGGERRKGGDLVDFVVERDGVVTPGGAGAVLHPGDRVQFTVHAGAGAFVGVWSQDGAGTIGPYAPSDGGLLRVTGPHRFAHSTRLDDVLGDEVFVAFRCESAVPSQRLADAVRGGTAPPGCEVERVTVRKVGR